MKSTIEAGLELIADQTLQNPLNRLFGVPVSFSRTRQSTKVIIGSYMHREVLLDSQELHEHKGIPISLRSGDSPRPYYPGEILSADKSTFRFRLTEDPNKEIRNLHYSAVRGMIILLREEGKITGSRVYTDP